jgi:hypothetical protein
MKVTIPFADLPQRPIDGFLHKISLIIRVMLDQWENPQFNYMIDIYGK